jgi:hypothetical protein
VLVTGSITTVGAAREHLQPSDVMRTDADVDDPSNGLRTLLVGVDGLETDDEGLDEEQDGSGQDGYGDDDDEEGRVLD